MKYKIVTAILIVGLLALAIGWGTSAYFSDTETSSGNQISAGVLDMKISDDNVNWLDGNPVTAAMSSPAGGLVPGQEFWTDYIYLKNVGSIPIWHVYLHFYDLAISDGATPESEESGDPDYLMYQIVLTAIEEYPNYDTAGGITITDFAANNGALANVYLDYWDATPAGDEDGSISLYDIIYFAEPAGSSPNTSFKQHTGDSDNPNTPAADSYATTVPYIPVGGTAWMRFRFKLLETTNNVAQGDIASFKVDFIGTQTTSPPQTP